MPDHSFKLGEIYTTKLELVCKRLKISKSDFFRRAIDEVWLKISLQPDLFPDNNNDPDTPAK